MQKTEALIAELKCRILEKLGIEDVTVDEVGTDAPLFKEGLGLDSIDALELVVMIEEHYGIKMKKMAQARAAFATVGTLAAFIQENRQDR